MPESESMRERVTWLVRVTLMFAISLLLIIFPLMKTAEMRQEMEAALSESVIAATEALNDLDVQIAESETVMSDITTDKFDDSVAHDAAEKALEDAREVAGNHVEEGADGRPNDELRNAIERNEALEDDAVNAADALKTAVGNLESGYEDTLSSELDKAVESATSAYDDSAGWVGSDDRDALSAAIEAASIEGMDYADMESALSALKEQTEAVSQATDAAKEAAEREKADESSVQPKPSDDGTWYVSYIWGGQSEIDTGAVVQWKSGYFCAHDWSQGGKMIASKPAYVVVDGVTYRYVSSINVSRDSTWSDVSGFALANGGIGFQTCAGNTYLITHYEPV